MTTDPHGPPVTWSLTAGTADAASSATPRETPSPATPHPLETPVLSTVDVPIDLAAERQAYIDFLALMQTRDADAAIDVMSLDEFMAGLT